MCRFHGEMFYCYIGVGRWEGSASERGMTPSRAMDMLLLTSALDGMIPPSQVVRY